MKEAVLLAVVPLRDVGGTRSVAAQHGAAWAAGCSKVTVVSWMAVTDGSVAVADMHAPTTSASNAGGNNAISASADRR